MVTTFSNLCGHLGPQTQFPRDGSVVVLHWSPQPSSVLSADVQTSRSPWVPTNVPSLIHKGHFIRFRSLCQSMAQETKTFAKNPDAATRGSSTPCFALEINPPFEGIPVHSRISVFQTNLCTHTPTATYFTGTSLLPTHLFSNRHSPVGIHISALELGFDPLPHANCI